MDTCPKCNSDQVNVDKLQYDYAFFECVNCDFEGYSFIRPEEDEALAGALFAEYRATSRGIKKGKTR